MLKIGVDKARVHVAMRNKTEGSVLQGSVQASCLGFETRLEIESSEPPERIEQLVAMAERGCFTMQALLAPVTFTHTTTLNGQPLPGAES
jgi:organic hydroperoxide reductase OsmC/OhrA